MCEICRKVPCSGGCPNYTPKIFATCEKCGGNIYDGDDFADLGSFYCTTCLDDMTYKELFKICSIDLETASCNDYYDDLL